MARVTALRVAAVTAATRLEAHNLIETHGLAWSFGKMMGINARIDPADDVYGFFTGYGCWSSSLRDYLADGWRTLSELMLLMESVQRPLLGAGGFLEFACGHGRFTRHLAKAIGSGAVTVSDVVADAVAFARDAFGVHGFVSAARPEDLDWTARHDVVFVLSLFSHLPRGSWGRWLKRLFGAVVPGGLLVFSTHGAEAARRQGVTLDGTGFYFAPSSESHAIDAQEYGTAFTDEAFVRAQMAQWVPEAELPRFAPVWFWHHQDAWVLRKTR